MYGEWNVPNGSGGGGLVDALARARQRGTRPRAIPIRPSSFQVSFKVYSSNPCAAWVGPSLSDASWDGDVRESRSAGLSTSFDDRWRKVKGGECALEGVVSIRMA